jgi:hypothetical protein
MLNNSKFMVALSIIVQVHEDNPTKKTIENFGSEGSFIIFSLYLSNFLNQD